jgi:hypothetical protein
VTVDRPDVQGRISILKVHARGKQIGKDVDFEKIARRTPGAPLLLTGMHRFQSVLCGAYNGIAGLRSRPCSGMSFLFGQGNDGAPGGFIRGRGFGSGLPSPSRLDTFLEENELFGCR